VRDCDLVAVRICIVMGAGASYANGAHYRPVRQRATLPPLDYTFFRKINQLGISIPAELSAYAGRLPTGSPFDSNGRMEEFLRDLFHDFLSQQNNATGPAVDAYRQMIDIYGQVLRRTTDWMRGDSYSGGPVGRMIAAAADIADEVDIITFNHDLVIENEIFKRRRLRRRWCIQTSYGAFSEGKTYLTQGGLPLFPNHDAACDHGKPITIHKMHGSLNWYVRIRGKEPTPGIMTGRVSSSDPDVMISMVRSVRSSMRRVRMSATGAGRHRWYVWPVIVPPIYAKQALIQSFMPSVWSEARKALADSDRVVFFGYSMPQADIEAEKLFQRQITSNSKVPWVGIVDPATAALSRIAGLMPQMPIRRYASAETFLSGDCFD